MIINKADEGQDTKCPNLLAFSCLGVQRPLTLIQSQCSQARARLGLDDKVLARPLRRLHACINMVSYFKTTQASKAV